MLSRIVHRAVCQRNFVLARQWFLSLGRRCNFLSPFLFLTSVCSIGYVLHGAVSSPSSKLVVHALETQKDDDDPDDKEEKPKRQLNSRELRFLRFASLEYNDHIYMTPRDFLDSVTQERPRTRVRRKYLTEAETEAMLKRTPPLRKSSARFLRSMDNDGLISYTEYLFLLSVLTKPKSGFKIAFDMFDTDGNHRVDKQEFMVIQALTLSLRSDGNTVSSPDPSLEQILSRGREVVKDKQRLPAVSLLDEPSEAKEDMTVQDTSLLRHFFGRKGDIMLTYEDFVKFNENLQTEVLELEFAEFSRGKPTISELDFARILLRYTVVHRDDYQEYLRRVEERIPEEKGVSFKDFLQFCQFLNNLDDFSIAIKLYTFADLAVSQAEFARAVKVSTGFALDPHVIHTVFQIFDVNNDGQLSYSEFIAVMKDRIHRGFRSHLIRGNYNWNAFKSCVREELKNF